MTKLQQYREAKAKLAQLEGSHVQWKNHFFRLETKAAAESAQPILDQLVKARQDAINDLYSSMQKELETMEQVEKDLKVARETFDKMHYECSHDEEGGGSALKPEYPFGGSEGSRPNIRCTICGETWK